MAKELSDQVDEDLGELIDPEIRALFEEAQQLPASAQGNYGSFSEGDVAQDSYGQPRMVKRPQNPEENY